MLKFRKAEIYQKNGEPMSDTETHVFFLFAAEWYDALNARKIRAFLFIENN